MTEHTFKCSDLSKSIKYEYYISPSIVGLCQGPRLFISCCGSFWLQVFIKITYKRKHLLYNCYFSTISYYVLLLTKNHLIVMTVVNTFDIFVS